MNIINNLSEIINGGKLVRFEAHQVPGKGWTVAKVTGSKRTGRTIERAEGFEFIDNYTMHQAQMAAENLTRDTFRARQQKKPARESSI